MTKREIRKFEKKHEKDERYKKYLDLTAEIEKIKKTINSLFTKFEEDYSIISPSSSGEFEVLSAFAKDPDVIYALLTDDCSYLKDLLHEMILHNMCYSFQRMCVFEAKCLKLDIDFFKKLIKDVLYINREINTMAGSIKDIQKQIEEL